MSLCVAESGRPPAGGLRYRSMLADGRCGFTQVVFGSSCVSALSRNLMNAPRFVALVGVGKGKRELTEHRRSRVGWDSDAASRPDISSEEEDSRTASSSSRSADPPPDVSRLRAPQPGYGLSEHSETTDGRAKKTPACFRNEQDGNAETHQRLRSTTVRKRTVRATTTVRAAADETRPYARRPTCRRCATTRVRSLAGPGPAGPKQTQPVRTETGRSGVLSQRSEFTASPLNLSREAVSLSCWVQVQNSPTNTPLLPGHTHTHTHTGS